MASLRTIKRDIDYLVNEVVTDAYLAFHFNVNKQDEIVAIIKEAVELRNNLFEAVNNPADKKDYKAVKKHFQTLRKEMFTKIDELFTKLSDTLK